MSEVCPRCREPVPPDTERCVAHGLYGVAPEAAGEIDDAPLLGQCIDGRYVLVDRLGGGGFGTVYRALQRPLKRPVALKVLNASLTATKSDRARFEREARSLSQLQSPHTVRLFDYGVVAEGPLANLAYMVMELAAGVSLAKHLRSGPMEAAELASMLTQVADALEEAHELGITHRDLKPDNILVAPGRDGRLRYKVIDFGVARVEGATQTTGALIGTPQYMSPEQCAGGGQPVDARTDIYALGVVVYECLSGRRPFDGADTLGVLIKQMNNEPPPLATAGAAPAVAALEPVVRAALAKNPAERPQTVRAFANAFTEALRAAGVMPSQPEPTRPPTEVRPVLTSSAGETPASTRGVALAETLGAEAPGTLRSFRDAAGEVVATLPAPQVGSGASVTPPPTRGRRRASVIGVAVTAGLLAVAYFAQSARGPEPRAPDAVPGAASEPPSAAAGPLGVAALTTPPTAAPVPVEPARVAASVSPPSLPPKPASAAVVAAAVSAQPPSATVRPSTAPSRPPATGPASSPPPAPRTAPPTQAPAKAAEAIAAIERALANCRCKDARAAQTLAVAQGADVERLRDRIAACRVPTVDEQCVDGVVR